jgi:hypothetical protein
MSVFFCVIASVLAGVLDNASEEFLQHSIYPLLLDSEKFVKIFRAIDFVHSNTYDDAFVLISSHMDNGIVQKVAFPWAIAGEKASTLVAQVWDRLVQQLDVHSFAFVGVSSKAHCCSMMNLEVNYTFKYKNKRLVC